MSLRLRIALIVFICAIIAAYALWPHRADLQSFATEWFQIGWSQLQETSPIIFFGAQGTLPALGAPISPFYLVGAELHGLTFSLIASGIALICSMSLGYWLASGLFRPVIMKLMAKSKFRDYKIDSKNHLRVILLLRIVPGVPFAFQNFILGLGGVPFRLYILVSWPFQYAWAVAITIFGESVINGKVGQAIFAICLIIAIVLVTKILRAKFANSPNNDEPATI